MNILVCFKAVPNWERVLESDWESFSPESDIRYAGTVFNCFDESALELALRLKEREKERGESARLTAVTVGKPPAPPLTEPLYAAGFDEIIVLDDDRPEFDPGHIALCLSRFAAEKDFDLILTGLTAGMADTGLVPCLLAESLSLPHIQDAQDISLSDEGIRVLQQDAGGLWQRDFALPALVSVGNSPAVLRATSLRARMQARGKAAAVLPGLCGIKTGLKLSRPKSARSLTMLPELGPQETARHLLAGLSQRETGKSGAGSGPTALPPGIYAVSCDERTSPERLSVFLEAVTPDLILVRDSLPGRALATKLSLKTGASLQSEAGILRFEQNGVAVKKRVCSANLDWERFLSFPAVITTAGPLPEGALDLSEQRSADSLAKRETAPEFDFNTLPNALPIREALLEPPVENSLSNPGCVIVCGAGAGSREACGRARLLAERLGAGFGLTRPAALNGWGRTDEIVGMSGSGISPDICLVLGASGAGAFLAGIEGAGKIIAVNTDPGALIFRNADLGASCDAPALIEAMLELCRPI